MTSNGKTWSWDTNERLAFDAWTWFHETLLYFFVWLGNGSQLSFKLYGKFEKPREIAIGIVLYSRCVMRPPVLSDQLPSLCNVYASVPRVYIIMGVKPHLQAAESRHVSSHNYSELSWLLKDFTVSFAAVLCVFTQRSSKSNKKKNKTKTAS